MDTVTILGTSFDATILLVIGFGALFFALICAKISRISDPYISDGKSKPQSTELSVREKKFLAENKKLADRVLELEVMEKLAPPKKKPEKKKHSRKEEKKDVKKTIKPSSIKV